MAPSGQRIGPVKRPARGPDRGKEQSDETATPLDEIGAGGKRETGGHPPLAARRPPNRPPPPEGPARTRPARPRLTLLPPAQASLPRMGPRLGRRMKTSRDRRTGRPPAGPPPFVPQRPRRRFGPPSDPADPLRELNARILSLAAEQSPPHARQLSEGRSKSSLLFDRSLRSAQIVRIVSLHLGGGGSADVSG